MSAEELPNGLLYGKLPGNKKWSLFYVEAVENVVHIYEGSAIPTRRKGRQLRTLVIIPSDWTGEEKSRKKNRYKFFVQRPDGKYLFRCDTPEERRDWLAYLQRMITVREDDHREDDSNDCNTNGADTSDTQQLEGYLWFWGWMSREDCEKRLRAEGEVGHFVVRINAMGEYVLSFWYPGGIFHHKIIYDGNLFRFERSTVPAEGASLPDLLRIYMGQYTGKIVPFGGSLIRLRPKDDSWRHQIHQQLASEGVPIAPTPPTTRYQYNPVELHGFEKQPSPIVLDGQPVLAPPSIRRPFNYEHMQVQKSASLDEIHLQLRKRDLRNVHARPPAEIPQLTPLNDWPSTREKFSYKHADVSRTQSLDELHPQERMKNLGHLRSRPLPPRHHNEMPEERMKNLGHVRTRPLPPRHHYGNPDEHHYANKSIIDQTQQLRQEEQREQDKHETPQQQWNELQQPASDNWDSDYQNDAMIQIHQKLGRR